MKIRLVFLLIVVSGLLLALSSTQSVKTSGVIAQQEPTSTAEVAAYEQVLYIEADTIHDIVIWHPEGNMIASALDGRETSSSIYVWQKDTGKLIATLEASSGIAEPIAWSPDGQFIASTSISYNIRIWSVENWEKTHDIQLDDYVDRDIYAAEDMSSIAWYPDGDRLAILNAFDLSIWDITAGTVETVYTQDMLIQSIAWSPDGTQIAGGEIDGRVRIWDAETLETLMTLVPDTRSISSYYLTHGKLVDWHPFDETLAIVVNVDDTQDSHVLIRDLSREGEIVAILEGHDGFIFSVAWSPDGTKLATASGSTVHIWDATTYEMLDVLEGHTSSVFYVSWSPDSRQLATTGSDQTIRIWEEQ